MANLAWYAGEGTAIANLSGSGIGFFSANGFGYSIPVGSYNERTFVTDSTGTVQNIEIDNCKYAASGTVVFGQTGSGINLLQLPNYLATVNPRFTHSAPVQVQNVRLYGSDRVHKNNNPSGVDIYAAQIIHPTTTQTLNGSGSPIWTRLLGSGSYLAMAGGQGVSGLGVNGTLTSSDQHDFYVAVSVSPARVGAAEAMLTMELEYL